MKSVTLEENLIKQIYCCKWKNPKPSN